MNSFKRDLIAINVSTLILGIAGLFAKWISLPAYVIIFGRSCVASVFLISLCLLLKKIRLKQSLKVKSRLLLSGFFMMLHWIFFYQAIQVSSVSIGVISTFTYPLITSLLEPFWIKKPFSIKLVFKTIIILLGLYILLDFNSSTINVFQGIAWGVLCAFTFTLRNLISRPLLQSMPAIWVMTCNVVVSALLLAPFCITAISSISYSNLILISIAGILVSGIGHSLFLQSMQSLSASLSSIFATLQLPCAVLASWAFLAEPISPSIIIGGSLILGVVLLEQIQILYIQNSQN